MIEEDFFLAWDFLCSVVLRIASSQALCGNVAAVAPLDVFSSHFPKTSRTWEYTDHCCSLPRRAVLLRHREQANPPSFQGSFWAPVFQTSVMPFTSLVHASHQHQPCPLPTSAMVPNTNHAPHQHWPCPSPTPTMPLTNTSMPLTNINHTFHQHQLCLSPTSAMTPNNISYGPHQYQPCPSSTPATPLTNTSHASHQHQPWLPTTSAMTHWWET